MAEEYLDQRLRYRFEETPQLYPGPKAVPEPKPMEHSHG
jgi:hypothetical protein